jgi:putative phosphoribosyl transferase
VAPPSTVEELTKEVDEVVCISTPEFFIAISLWYDEFPQISDEQVRELLKETQMTKEVAGAAGSR